MGLSVGAAALAAACQAAPAPELPERIALPVPEERVAAWRADLACFAREMPRRHPRPFAVLSEERFRSAVEGLARRIPELDDAGVVIEIARLAAAVGDGHTGFHLYDARLGFQRHPLWLISLADGIFVKGAVEPNLGALGCRVVRIGELSIDEACARVAPLVPRDNEMGLRAAEGAHLTLGEVLAVIGATEDPRRARFVVVDAEGRECALESRTLQDGENPPLAVAYRDGGGAPLAERLRVEPYVHALLEEGRVVYAQVNACRDAAAFESFCRELFADVDRERPERLIVDLRSNAGGDSSVLRPLLRGLRERPWLRGRLFALIGRRTFSSGMWAAIDLQARHGAVLVGEPTGGRPHAPGDARRIVLPRSTLAIGVSTRTWTKGGPRYAGDALEPDVLVTESSSEHFAGRDPVLDAALALELAE